MGPAHLVLVGLPGAGKTTVGRGAARRLDWPFVDLDEEIERREGMRVSEIFANCGEPYFRRCELELTRTLAARPRSIVSPGGGWITNPEVMALLRPAGRIIYLHVTPETALARLGAGVAARPLLTRPDPLGELRRLYAQRDPLYRLADSVVDAESMSLQDVTAVVTRLAASGERS